METAIPFYVVAFCYCHLILQRQNAEDSSVVSSSEDRNRVTKLTTTCHDASVQTIKVVRSFA